MNNFRGELSDISAEKASLVQEEGVTFREALVLQASDPMLTELDTRLAVPAFSKLLKDTHILVAFVTPAEAIHVLFFAWLWTQGQDRVPNETHQWIFINQSMPRISCCFVWADVSVTVGPLIVESPQAKKRVPTGVL